MVSLKFFSAIISKLLAKLKLQSEAFSRKSLPNPRGRADTASQTTQTTASQAQRTSKSLGISNPLKSVGMKLFMIFFFCIVGLVLIVGSFSYNKSKTIITEKVAHSTEQTITLAADKMEIIFRNFEDITMQLLQDPNLAKDLQLYIQPNVGAYEKLNAQRTISDKLNVFTNGKSGIASIMILPLALDIQPISTDGNSFSSNDKYVDTEWFKQIVSLDGAASWLETKKKGFTGNTEARFAVGRLLKNLNTNSKDFVLIFQFGMNVLDNSLAQIKIGDTGQIVVLNEANKVVRASNLERVEQPFDIHFNEDQLESSLKEAKSMTQNHKGQENLVIYKQMKTSGWNIAAIVPVSELVKETKEIWNLTLLIALISVVVATLAGFFVARMIGRPLITLRNLMKNGEQGDLTVRMNHNSKDEIGQLGNSFNQMMEQITLLVRQTNQSASDVLVTAAELLSSSNKTATSAREIAIATEEIANGASSLAIDAEKGNGLTHEISSQMEQVIEANALMGESATEVQKASELGSRYMAELTTKTKSTEIMTRSMVEKVDRLKESTSSIRKILDVLNNMTKQTNILSLNATIEAARAGAAGKGFMVVADEIRKLAEQSKQSIQIVGNITLTIQKEIDETVAVLSDAYPLFKEQIQSVKEAETIFTQVQSQMGGFVQQLSDVTSSIELLNESQTVLTEAMTNVSAVSQQSSATSEEVASLSNEQLSVSEGLVKLSEKLEHLSKSLQGSLSKFRV